jgi:hypothetical protein
MKFTTESWAAWQEKYASWLEGQSPEVRALNAEFPCGMTVNVQKCFLRGGQATEEIVPATVMRCDNAGAVVADEDPRKVWPPELRVWDWPRFRELNARVVVEGGEEG